MGLGAACPGAAGAAQLLLLDLWPLTHPDVRELMGCLCFPPMPLTASTWHLLSAPHPWSRELWFWGSPML